MAPFEFIIVFLSFIYALALTHLLLGFVGMVRRRRVLVVSWPHALWMLNALLLLSGNWLSLWDFRGFDSMPLAFIAIGLVFSVLQYFLCALVAPDFDDGGDDLRVFHQREGRTYIGLSLAMMIVALGVNLAAGGVGVKNWANQNAIVLAMLPTAALPLVMRARWVQVAGPAVLAALQIAFMVIFYPTLTRA